ncbi:MAG: outer membrane lipoprotein-sorting protein [Bacteroidota bacterium]
MKVLRIILPIFFLTFLMANSMEAQSPEQKGLAVAQAADQADVGFESSTSNLKMILRNKNGQVSERLLSNRTLEMADDGDKSLIVFQSPRDVKGTATLTYTHRQGSDDQWLYLPAIARVKRISSNNKSGPFMGSEFAYEDLSSQEVDKYTYKYLRAEKTNGAHIEVVERFPVDKKSGYTRQIAWYNKDKGYRLEKIEFYDRKNALLKTLTYHDYDQYAGQYWRSGKMVMTNHQSGKVTELLFENYAFKTGLKESDFTQNGLKRAK